MGFAESLVSVDKTVRAVLGQSVLYTPGTGVAVTVQGVFDAAYRLADVGTAGVSASSPAVFLTLADLPSDPNTDAAFRVTIAGTVYRARAVEPDGTGAVLILLTEA